MNRMRAWRLEGPGREFRLTDVAVPEVRPGTVLLRMEATALLTYLKDYIAGRLPGYRMPSCPFTPGTNGVAIVEQIGADVWHLTPGQRVILSPHVVAQENVAEPAQVLSGLTAMSPDSAAMMDVWRDGTLAEYTLAPVASVTPLPPNLAQIPVERLATFGKFAVPLGGLLRSRLAAGENLIVNGATGYFGSAAVLLGVAMGAGIVVAAGRKQEVLRQLALSRVAPVALTGDIDQDVAALKAAARLQVGLDIVGRSRDSSSTIATLRSLERSGRMVLMGSSTVPLPIDYGEVMRGNLEIMGQFMYPRDTFRRLISLVQCGALDLDRVRVSSFDFEQVPAAMEAASHNQGLDCTVVRIA